MSYPPAGPPAGQQWPPASAGGWPAQGGPQQQGYPGYPGQQAYPPQGYPQAPQQPYQQQYPQQQYPQQQYPQHHQPQQYAAAPDAGTLTCRFCGHYPAAYTTFRGHMGMIIVMQFRSQTGPFCRDCGLATFRDMTASTLIGGWWGYLSLVICPITVLINLVRRGAVAKLPPPMPPPNGQHRGHPRAHPMDPGKPLMTRPAALVGMALPLVPILGFIGIAVLGAVTGG